VESHELAVVAGAGQTLSRPTLQAVLVEIAPEHRTDALLATFAHCGLHPHSYEPKTRTLTRTPGFHWHNTLFVRDAEFVANRLRSASAVRVGELSI
jgi:hypothetical protein